MSSKVKFFFKNRREKQAEIFPKTPELKEALLAKDNKDFVLVKTSDLISFPLMEMMFNVEILETTRLGDEKLEMIKEEIIAIREASLLLKIWRSLQAASTPRDKDLFQALKLRLDSLKLT